MDAIKSAFTFKNKDNDDYHPLSEDASIRAPLNRSIYDTSMTETNTDLLDNYDFDQVIHSKREERKIEQESEKEFQSKSYEFLKNLGDLYTEFVDQKKEIANFLKYCRYIDNVANNLCKNVPSPTDRRLEISDQFYKEDNFISTLMTLGFEMDINSKGDLVLSLGTQPSKRLLTFITDFLKREYLSKASAVPELREESKKIENKNKPQTVQTVSEAVPQTDQARFLASKHEQRITQKYHPSSVNHNSKAVPMTEVKKKLPDNWSFQRNTISTDAASASFQNPQTVSYRNMNTQEIRANLNNQLSDYRERMKNRKPEEIPTYVPPEQDTTSSVFSSIKKHIKKAIGKEEEPKQKGGMMTGLEIEKKRIEEDKVAFGKKALELTNEFRAKQNMRPLIWNQELCDIAMQHSKNMAEGVVPFSHEGFEDRCNQIRFLRWSACENVAYNSNCQSPPTAAVNGWIESPGHRRNMLSNSNACGIACYRNENGTWYFTQFIVLKDETFTLFS